jgi:hypothetical protein
VHDTPVPLRPLVHFQVASYSFSFRMMVSKSPTNATFFIH